jgi:hypothetical protein
MNRQSVSGLAKIVRAQALSPALSDQAWPIATLTLWNIFSLGLWMKAGRAALPDDSERLPTDQLSARQPKSE